MLTTKQDVVDHILKDKFYEDVLLKYLSNKNERNEFRQELWLILLEMPEHKLIGYYNQKCLKYVYIGIINNQIKSSTSPWHKKFRNRVLEYNGNLSEPDESFSSISKKVLDESKLKYIESTLILLEKRDPRLKRDITVFRMHFEEGLSYRKIAAKTRISVVSIWKYVNNVIFLLQKDINKIDLNNDILFN
jgi:hypothetical protein